MFKFDFNTLTGTNSGPPSSHGVLFSLSFSKVLTPNIFFVVQACGLCAALIDDCLQVSVARLIKIFFIRF